MGTGQSALKGLEIEEKAVEITDFWTHHRANIDGSNFQNMSVFISEPSLHSTASFGKPSPLEKNAKNLMLHRHPSILKYVSSWSKGSKFFLATEEVKPLVQVIGTETTLQICIGLHNILRALLFLHENATASHNNICSTAIYVTADGSWKLGGLEYLCQFSDLTSTYFRKIKSYRYEKAISPEEDESICILSDPTVIDRYAFGVLAEEVLRLKDDDEVPGLDDFKDFCKQQLKRNDTSPVAFLSSLLHHPFFSHDFLQIHAFLTELPLKTEMEKKDFFLNIVMKLQTFPEKIVAEQLGKLLLSRLVLLDRTAQTKLLPILLKPKENEDNLEDQGLFTVPTFKAHLIPKLLQMFCVRDASIRLLLLSHLNSFIHVFEREELKSKVLPELLVGIKDTDDYLVSITLRALSDLVPILGAATVIGGNRGKLFADGRPKKIQRLKKPIINTQNLSRISDMSMLSLPERPSPDGGEDKSESNFSCAEEENWSDWETQDIETKEIPNLTFAINKTIEKKKDQQPSSVSQFDEISAPSLESTIEETHKTNTIADRSKYSKKPIISDISELDIKHSKLINHKNDEYDFFTDMEPIIQKPQVLHVKKVSQTKTIFDVNSTNNILGLEEDNGWGHDLNDLDIDNVELNK